VPQDLNVMRIITVFLTELLVCTLFILKMLLIGDLIARRMDHILQNNVVEIRLLEGAFVMQKQELRYMVGIGGINLIT
jgi:hypothetical protein